MATRERVASKKAFLFLFSLASIIQGMYSTYFVSTLTTIERLYEIQSKTVGAIMSATEFGQIMGSLLVAYYGGKGNKPKWITVCMTLSALAAILSTSPHFLLYISHQHQGRAISSHQHPLAADNGQQQAHAEMALAQGQLCSNSVILPNANLIAPSWREHEMPSRQHKQQQQQQQQQFQHQQFKTMARPKQPTEIIFVIFFMSLLVIGFGSTAMTTLGIPFIDDIVTREESPLYLGVTIGLRIFGPALGFLLGSACIQLNVDFPFNYTTSQQSDPTTALNWIGAWWLGLILISVPLLLLAVPMYYFSLITKQNKTTTNNRLGTNNDDLECDKRLGDAGDKHHHDYEDAHHNHHHLDGNDGDDEDDSHELEYKMIVSSSVPTSPTPSPTNGHAYHNHHTDHHHINLQSYRPNRYIEYRLNDAYVDHERSTPPPKIQIITSSAPGDNSQQQRNQIKSNLRSLDTSNLLSLDMIKASKAPTTKHEHNCDDADSVLTKMSLDLSHSGSSIASNQTNHNQHNDRETRHRNLSSLTSASSPDHHHNHHCSLDGMKQHKVKAGKQKKQQQQLKHDNKINSLSSSIRRLISNRLFMLRLMSSVLHILPIAGFYTFLPKYLIEQYKVGASTASAISGLAGILFVGLGAFIGGSLMRIFNVNSKSVTRWIASSALAYALGMLVLMQLGCPQENLVTYDLIFRDSNYIDQPHLEQAHISCSSSCNCRQSVYNPICVQQTTYLSPCLAGCTNYTQLDDHRILYNDCKCHITTASTDQQHLLTYKIDDLPVTSGPCKSYCGNLKWYIMVFSLFVLIHASCEVGSMMLNLRCVDSKDRALALGMVTFASSLFGTIPCSIIYGAVIDLTCIYWETTEPESSTLISSSSVNQQQTAIEPPMRGACRVYDSDKFRQYLHGLTALVMIVAFMIDSIICKKASKINFFQQTPTCDAPNEVTTTNTITTTSPSANTYQLNNQSVGNEIDQDDEDDGVVGHMSEDDELDCKLHQRQVITIDCAAL